MKLNVYPPSVKHHLSAPPSLPSQDAPAGLLCLFIAACKWRGQVSALCEIRGNSLQSLLLRSEQRNKSMTIKVQEVFFKSSCCHILGSGETLSTETKMETEKTFPLTEDKRARNVAKHADWSKAPPPVTHSQFRCCLKLLLQHLLSSSSKASNLSAGSSLSNSQGHSQHTLTTCWGPSVLSSLL